MFFTEAIIKEQQDIRLLWLNAWDIHKSEGKRVDSLLEVCIGKLQQERKY